MSFARSLAPILTLLAVFPGCDGATSPADFASDYADHLKDVADALQNVKTRADADAVATDVEALLASAASLQEKAQNLTNEGDPPKEVQDRLMEATKRLGSEIARLQGDNLITPKLRDALEQVEYSSKAMLNYAKAGALPEPETPLEEAYVEYVHAKEELNDVWNRVTDLASAQAALPEFEKVWQRRDTALIRIAQLGGEMPPFGAPEKYRTHLNAASDRLMQTNARLQNRPDADAVAELLADRTINVATARRSSP
jgi:hypothetical protein